MKNDGPSSSTINYLVQSARYIIVLRRVAYSISVATPVLKWGDSNVNGDRKKRK